MFSIYSRTVDAGAVDRQVLGSFFRSERGRNDTIFFHRLNQGPSRGVFRLLFPRFLLKLTPDDGRHRYTLKPDGLAILMFTVFAVVGIAWTIDPDGADGTPTWLPIVFAGWFVLLAVREVRFTKKALDLATSGRSLHQLHALGGDSSAAAQVLAILEAEEGTAKAEEDTAKAEEDTAENA